MKPEQENGGGNFDFMPSTTAVIRVGCGSLYATICYDEAKRFRRIFIPRNTKFFCPVTTRDAIAKLVTFQGKRNLRQCIKDLRGSKAHHCDKYNVTSQAASCFDGVSKILEKWQKSKRKKYAKQKKM
jgi:hypothetical protein